MDPDEILSALEANHVPLLWIRPTGNSAYDWLLESKAFHKAITREQAYFDELRAQTLSLRDEFKQYGIEMAFIKAVDFPPVFPYNTGNQDILVRSEQVDLARRLLRKLGHIEVRHLHERKKYLYRTFPGGKEGLSVHLHEHVGWDGNTYLEADGLWSRMVTSKADPELLIPSPEDVFIITAIHAFDENKEIRLADLVKLRYCLATYMLDWDYVDSIATCRGWRYNLYAALYIFDHVNRLFWGTDLLPSVVLDRARHIIEQQRLSAAFLKRKICQSHRELLFPIPFSYCKYFSFQKLWRDPTLRERERFYLLIEYTLRGIGRKLGLRTQPSMLICFSGIDGSGKTCQAQALRNAFITCEVNTKYVWMRGSTSVWLNPLKRLAAIILGSRQLSSERADLDTAQNRERIRNIKNRWVRVLYPWMIFFEFLLFYLKEVIVPLSFGQVIICDRYVVDHIADLMDL
ncbi:MAG: nucleotidyltransferase family protein, partial [Armatimonadota bacterium]|nr:nucleotidyltransferase family protein [Armatimonadota bacterium]